ncbi:MAG: hypothetical protein Tsb005_17160 [Gammaproteobacteria bacterium]
MPDKLLIVDDEMSVLNSLKRTLMLDGYEVITTDKPETALAILETQQIPLVISDYQMPHMNGAEFLFQAKQRHPHLVAIMLSGVDDVSMLSEAINQGAIYRFLCKPWQHKELLESISAGLRHHQHLLTQHYAEHSLTSALEAVAIVDVRGVIQTTNPTFNKLFNYQTQSSIKQTIRDLVKLDEHHIPNWDDIQQLLLLDQHWQGELTLTKFNGQKAVIFLSISPIEGHDKQISEYIYTMLDITQHKEQEWRHAQELGQDPVTQLANRYTFVQRLTALIEKNHIKPYPLAVIFLSLQQFRDINVTLGYAVGDELLHQVAQRLKQWAKHHEIIARLAHDDFAIILADENADIEFVKYLQDLEDVFTQPFYVKQYELRIIPWIGVSVYPADGHEASELMQHADMAMKYARHNNLMHYQCYQSTMQQQSSEKLALMHELFKAVKKPDFELYYQPIMNPVSGDPLGFEALIRWPHAKRGIITPDQFIGLAERSGLIFTITAWTLQQAMCQLQQWNTQFGMNYSMSINISPQEILHGDIISLVSQALHQSHIKPENIQIEITEQSLIENNKRARHVLKILHDLGIKLALDDFGTGYSSLSYLMQFPFDTLKLDRVFITEAQHNYKAALVIESVAALCERLNIALIAEGVETQEQWQFLNQNFNCSGVQGFLFGRPDTAANTELTLSQINKDGACLSRMKH